MKDILNRSILTALVVGLLVVLLLIAFIAAITGNYDSHSVRALIDDLKWIVGLLGGGVAIARGIMAAGERQVQAQTLASMTADATDYVSHGGTQGVASSPSVDTNTEPTRATKPRVRKAPTR